METINYITDGNYHEDRQPDINAYPFSLLHLGELRRSEIWDAATRRFETAGGTFGTWLTETRAFVKLR